MRHCVIFFTTKSKIVKNKFDTEDKVEEQETQTNITGKQLKNHLVYEVCQWNIDSVSEDPMAVTFDLLAGWNFLLLKVAL